MSHWRDKCRPIIARVLAETQGQEEKQIRAALYRAYPFGMRQYWPYKVWLDEIQVQRGLKVRKEGEKIRREMIDAGQLELFKESNDERTK